MQPTPQDDQLMSKHRVLSFKPQLRLEWRGQDVQNETEQLNHSASLGDSVTSSTRMRFSVHTTYRHWVSTARAVAVFGFLARDTVRQAIVRAERLMAELIRTVDGLFARFPLNEENKAQRARAVDQRARVLAQWLDAQAARDSNGDDEAWRLKPCPSLMFVNGAGELDQKHDQDLRDTCVMLLDRAGCDLLTICDITGHSYRSAQTIVKHYRARNADRADAGIDRLELQVRKEGMKG